MVSDSTRLKARAGLKIAALFFVGLIALLALVLVWASFDGQRNWDQTRKSLLARGEKLSLVEFVFPPVPPEANFFADPLWDELRDLVEAEYTDSGVTFTVEEVRLPPGERQLDALQRGLAVSERNVLIAAFPVIFTADENANIDGLVGAALEAGEKAAPQDRRQTAELILALTALAEPVISRLDELALRPEARFQTEFPPMRGASDESARYLRIYNRLLVARAWAELTLGDTEAARRDALTLLRLPGIVNNQPLLISGLHQIALGHLALAPIEGGLDSHTWTDSDLLALEPALARLDFLGDLALVLRGERGFFNQSFERRSEEPFALGEWAFGFGQQARSNSMFQEWIDALDGTPVQGLNAEMIPELPNPRISKNPLEWLRAKLIFISLPNLKNIVAQTALLQNRVLQVRIVCGLERYFLKYHTYPPSLEVLVPEFLETLPDDLVTIRPMEYRLTSPTQFALWSAGWDQANIGDAEGWTWGKRPR